MGVVQRFEQRLGGLVEGAFAKVFKGEVQPVELAGALRRAADSRRTVVDADRVLTVNSFTIALGDADYRRLHEWSEPLTRELVTMLREHAADEHYSFVGPVTVQLFNDPSITTGTFRVECAMVAGTTDEPLAPSPGAAKRPAPPGAAAMPGDTAAPARPVAAGNPRLLVNGREHRLSKPVTSIGRGRDTDLHVDDPGVSRRHAEIRVTDDDVELLDAGSTNGTLLNGKRVSRARLLDGDTFSVGSTTITFARDRG